MFVTGNKGGLEMFDARRWMDRLERLMIAITFAEAGQREMALGILNEKPKKRRWNANRAKKNAEQRPVLRV
jgi:hypothetical protein